METKLLHVLVLGGALLAGSGCGTGGDLLGEGVAQDQPERALAQEQSAEIPAGTEDELTYQARCIGPNPIDGAGCPGDTCESDGDGGLKVRAGLSCCWGTSCC